MLRRFVPPLLRENVVFRRFWLAQTISLFGDQISLIAIPLTAVLVLDANASQMGYLVAAELTPNLLFALHAGAWIDRRGRRRQTMIFTDLARAGLFATIPLAYAFDALTMEQLYAVAFAAGTMTVLFSVSYASLFIALVEREHYVTATSWLAGSRAFSFVAGPSLGGLLVQALKAPFALLVDAVSFLFSALFLSSIAPEEPPTEQAERGHVMAGIRYVFRNPTMRASLLVDGDDQPLQLHLLGALHPLRSARAGRERGNARARPRCGRRRRPDRLDRDDAAEPPDRDRPGPPARRHPLPGAAPARAARGRADVARSWRCSSSPSSAAASA